MKLVTFLERTTDHDLTRFKIVNKRYTILNRGLFLP